MFQSHIILTQTFVDKEKLKKFLALGFDKQKSFENGVDYILSNYSEIVEEETSKTWQKLEGQRRVLAENYTKKKDFVESLMTLYEVHSEPTLLFLGDLSDYSLPLQEGMLRLLEEPPTNLIIVLFAQNKSEVLPTISSRSRFHLLKKDFVLKHLDGDLLEKTKKKLPEVSSFTKELLQGQNFEIPDLKKVEREEISFWLWQIISYLQEYYKQNPTKQIAKVLEKVIKAQKLNSDNLQKKFVLGWLK